MGDYHEIFAERMRARRHPDIAAAYAINLRGESVGGRSSTASPLNENNSSDSPTASRLRSAGGGDPRSDSRRQHRQGPPSAHASGGREHPPVLEPFVCRQSRNCLIA